MKPILILSTLLLVGVCACRKEAKKTTSVFMNEATITGPNMTAQMCGAAYLIRLHGIADSIAEFDSVAATSALSLSTAAFPVNIKLNWHHNASNTCDTLAHIITIDSMMVE